ncbi:MAG: dephospho-CoA kinase [Bacteroidota bacterium]
MKQLIIGLTGGIGSGKSVIAKIFIAKGIPVFDSDSAAKNAYYDIGIRQKVIELLGKDSYLSNGDLNKKNISQKIFDDKNLLSCLNSIIHPFVGIQFKKWQTKHFDSSILVKETALLFETGIAEKVNKKILVTAPLEIRISRVMKRDKLERNEVIRKISNQWDDELKIPLSDFVINNDGKELILPKVLDWIGTITDIT